MIRIDVEGRRDQGAEVACQVLAHAFARTGASVRTMTIYDEPNRRAPVIASLRVDPGDGADAGGRIVLDPALLEPAPRDGRDRVVLVNSPTSPCSRLLGAARVVAVDADAIVRGLGRGATLAAAVAGAFAGATGLLALDEVACAVAESGRAVRPRAVQAAALAYREAAEAAGSAAMPAVA